jgi:SAM-dependent methyltransferase
MNPAPRFDRLARLYRWMELFSFGPWLMRCRVAFLGELCQRGASVSRALVLGDGDGRFTAQLLAALPAVQVDAVDLSPAMLAELKRHAGLNADRVAAQVADVRAFVPPSLPYALFVTHFLLDCLTTEEVRALAAKLRASAAADALWMVSEFATPEGFYGRFVAWPMVRLLYLAFGLLTGLRTRTLPDHPAALADAGFELAERRAWLGGLLVSELWRVSDVKMRLTCHCRMG